MEPSSITYEQYCEQCTEFKNKLYALPISNETRDERHQLFKEYMDFALEYPEYYQKQFVDPMKHEYAPSPDEVSTAVKDVIDEFNERIHSGKYTAEQCYCWLSMEKNRLSYKYPGMIHDYQFLYPERIDFGNVLKNLKQKEA